MPLSESDSILRLVRHVLSSSFHIEHTTIQVENEPCDVAHGCVIPVHHMNGTTSPFRAENKAHSHPVAKLR
jgi:cobalt-zinc-cadmium efflux system protein